MEFTREDAVWQNHEAEYSYGQVAIQAKPGAERAAQPRILGLRIGMRGCAPGLEGSVDLDFNRCR